MCLKAKIAQKFADGSNQKQIFIVMFSKLPKS